MLLVGLCLLGGFGGHAKGEEPRHQAPDPLFASRWDSSSGAWASPPEEARPPGLQPAGAAAPLADVPRSWFWTAVAAFLITGGFCLLLLRSSLTRKKTEAALRRSERRFRQIAENFRDVFWLVAPDFSRMDYVNPAYEIIWGRSCESLYQDPMSWTESLFPHDRQTVLDFFDQRKQTFSDGCAFPDFRIVDSEGVIRWIHVRTFASRFTNGSENLIVGICQDITRSKFFEASLRESEQKWRSLMENSPDHIMLIDLDGHVLFANRGFMGIETPHLIGKPLIGLMSPEVKPVLRTCMDRVVERGVSDACRVEKNDAHHRKSVFEMRMGPVTVNDQTVAVAVSSSEITQRVAQERALHESEALHRTFFNDAPTGIAIQDFSAVGEAVREMADAGIKDLRSFLMTHPSEVSRLVSRVKLVKVNQALLDLYQAPSEEAMLGTMVDRLKKSDWQHFIDQVVAFTSGQDRYEGEARNLDFKGQTLHLIIRKVVVQRSENGLSKILTSLIDVTRLKSAEKERELLMLQLQQAQKMEAIGTLAGGVAHDFNNILSIILGNSELAVGDIPSNHPVLQNLQEIKKASLRAKDIVRQLLGLSRKSEQVLKPMHLSPVIEEAVNFLRATIPANIEIKSSLSADNDVVRADATQIHQIMINLFTNASHAMEENGGTLSVQAENMTLRAALPGNIHSIPPGEYLRVTVADTGTGIPEEIKGRIFDPYFTTKPLDKGTGMGLSMVQGIMKNNGGGIVLRTKAGEGTCFELYFPLVDKATQTVAVEEEELLTGSERILFVDDEEMIVKLTEKILDRLGYRVRSCMDPYCALSLIEADPTAFDMVITDLTMPGMTGDQLVQAIRRVLPTLPVILCTGYSDRLSQEKVEALAIGDVLEKPVAVVRLAAAIRQVFDRARSAG